MGARLERKGLTSVPMKTIGTGRELQRPPRVRATGRGKPRPY